MTDAVIKALLVFSVGLAITLIGGSILAGMAAWQRWREGRER